MISKDAKETSDIAKMFLDKILKGDLRRDGALVICLSGELGAGKTAFTKAVARHLKIKEKISSPTFVIIKNYELKTRKYKKFFHLDAYRLKNEEELFRLGWEEIIGNKKHLVFLEWPENVSKAIPKDAIFIYISHAEGGDREIKFNHEIR